MEATKVTYMRLHDTIYLKGPGDLGLVFPAEAGKTINDLYMVTNDIGVVLSGSRLGSRFKLLVPFANIKVACLELE